MVAKRIPGVRLLHILAASALGGLFVALTPVLFYSLFDGWPAIQSLSRPSKVANPFLSDPSWAFAACSFAVFLAASLLLGLRRPSKGIWLSALLASAVYFFAAVAASMVREGYSLVEGLNYVSVYAGLFGGLLASGLFGLVIGLVFRSAQVAKLPSS